MTYNVFSGTLNPTHFNFTSLGNEFQMCAAEMRKARDPKDVALQVGENPMSRDLVG